jgi:hypothetical protein
MNADRQLSQLVACAPGSVNLSDTGAGAQATNTKNRLGPTRRRLLKIFLPHLPNI